MIVILIGYMASGKSTLGKILAEKLKYDFIDLDDYIEGQEKLSVKDIFKKKGELYFRKSETLYLSNILKTKNNIVLALGGGTPCYGNNMDLISATSGVKSFYLKATLPHLVNKLFKKKNKRPLIAHLESKEELRDFIGKHLFERAPYYEQADFSISVDHKTKKEIVKSIRSLLV
ncbi:shikimate kinase [Aestuariivivens sediminicola]|uniref:shikimate kinase n=1 Tax=Aestuariivivens sediminicola TaxID=2913560 RepID=UPI001F5721C6|nr:shikimate kinase [Aestuariivivens sediminicola]